MMDQGRTRSRLAVRTAPFQESVIREMTRLGDEAGAVNLSQGLPDFDPPPAMLEAASAAIWECNGSAKMRLCLGAK